LVGQTVDVTRNLEKEATGSWVSDEEYGKPPTQF
jgi:hypothetical protein